MPIFVEINEKKKKKTENLGRKSQQRTCASSELNNLNSCTFVHGLSRIFSRGDGFSKNLGKSEI